MVQDRRGWRRAGLVALAGAGMIGARRLARGREEDLTGQVALITGGSRGLGFLIARDLGQQGCRVAICARDAAELERARADLAGQGIEVFAQPCDVADAAQVRDVIEAARRRFGRIDILVNNAGVIQVGPLDAMTRQDFEDALNIMYWGVVHPTLEVLPEMRTRGSGRIVNITSIGGKISVPHLLPYSSAKFAAVGFSEGLRAELAGTGVQVTTIVPGLMRTGSHLNALFKGRQEEEFGWFSLGASLPLISMDAERAAHQVVQAARRGEAERILSLPAAAAARVNGVAPAFTTNVIGLTGRLMLPEPSDDQALIPGMELLERRRSRPLQILTALGRRAAERYHQFPGPKAPA